MRVKLDEPLTFDIPYKDITIRVKADKEGMQLWKRGKGNLDAPRALDKTVEVEWIDIGKIAEIKWEDVGNAGYCYSGSRSGIKEGRGPAASRGGLHYLTHKAK